MLSIISYARIIFQSSWAYFVEFALISFYRSPRGYQKILKNESFVLKNTDKFIVFFMILYFTYFANNFYDLSNCCTTTKACFEVKNAKRKQRKHNSKETSFEQTYEYIFINYMYFSSENTQ